MGIKSKVAGITGGIILMATSPLIASYITEYTFPKVAEKVAEYAQILEKYVPDGLGKQVYYVSIVVALFLGGLGLAIKS